MFRIRRRQKPKVVDVKQFGGVVNEELKAYLKRDELQKYLEGIEEDKAKKELWNSLSPYRKIKVLRYALKKKGGTVGER